MLEIKAILFDQDGVIVDTERDGHRVAFNRAFESFGFNVRWDVAKYHEMLQVGGGKERMRHQLRTEGFGREIPPDQEDALIVQLHQRKTDIFIEMIDRGELPLRPGVHRLMQEASHRGLMLGICTTSAERAARAILEGLLADIRFDLVLAGDIVKRKKPDPEIYLLALEKTGLRPEQCVVVEDSSNGVKAAKAAGMNVVATVNEYTRDEDLSLADVVLSCLGEEDGPRAELIRSRKSWKIDGIVRVTDLMNYFQ
ncbi:MAG: HAD-IA family hydrolase [Phycisphaerae bacterium]|nr:HAD-IA family hydrolase [Phycisphaerae bacterium]